MSQIIKKALIEQYPDTGIRNIDTAYAELGFSSLDYKILKTDLLSCIGARTLKDLKIESLDVAFGTVAFTRQIWRMMGVQPPKSMDYNIEPTYLKRKIVKQTVKEVMESYNTNPRECFVKPVSNKALHVKAIRSKEDLTDFLLLNMDKLSEDYSDKVWVSEYKEIQSEWRCYVQRQDVQYASCYKGSFRVSPDWQEVENMIASTPRYFDKVPVCYSLDVGVDDDGNTFCIELNDAWSLGNYGFDKDRFAYFLQLRWDEIVNGIG